MSDTSTLRARLLDIRGAFRELRTRRLDLFLAYGPAEKVAALKSPLHFGPEAAQRVLASRRAPRLTAWKLHFGPEGAQLVPPACRPVVPGLKLRGDPRTRPPQEGPNIEVNGEDYVWWLTAHGDREAWLLYVRLADEACDVVHGLPGVQLVYCPDAAVKWTALLAQHAATEPVGSAMHAGLETWVAGDTGVHFYPFESDQRDRIRELLQHVLKSSPDVPSGEVDWWCVELPGVFRRSELVLEKLANEDAVGASLEFYDLVFKSEADTTNPAGRPITSKNLQGRTLPEEHSDPVSHSPDFTSVNWYGRKYTFAKGQQAQAVRVLWEAWESGGHSVTQERVAEEIGSNADKFSLAKVFRRKKRGGGYEPHPAWGTMIRQASKGCYRLAPPESA